MPRIKVVLLGGPPWGFRLQGGGQQALRISRVTSNGKANNAGVKAGSKVTAINGTPTSALTLSAAHALTKQSPSLTIELDAESSSLRPAVSSSFSPSSASSNSTVIPSHHPTTNGTLDRVQTNSKSDTKQNSNESDLEEAKIWRDSFAGEDSCDVTSLLSDARSDLLTGNQSYSRGRNSDYSFVSDTVSTSEGPNKPSEETEELNLTDISAPPSEASEDTVLGSENDYCEETSYSTDRDSKAYSDEDGYYIDQYKLDEESQYRLELYNRNRALDETYHTLDDNLPDNPRYYSTIVEESEEEEDEADYLEPSLKNPAKKHRMGLFHSRNSGASNEDEKVKKRKSNSTNKTDQQHVSSTLSDDWRMSQASTNTAVSTSTNADSDDTLADNMSELSSVNSHLSYLGGGEHKSLERGVKHNLKDSSRKEDPEATPVASPVLPPRKKNATVKHAIHELESIELAAQNLLQKNHVSAGATTATKESAPPAPPTIIHISKKKSLTDQPYSEIKNGNIEEDYVDVPELDSIIAEQEAKFAEHKRKELSKHRNVIISKNSDEKPPAFPCNGSKSEPKQNFFTKNSEFKPYISRESYNEEKVLKDVETLRESYKECDLNDFLDKLATTAEAGKVDDAVYEQLLADIKADVERSKRSSTESLQSSISTASRKENLGSSQESLTPVSRPRASSAVRKFENFKARVLQLMRGRKKHKSNRSKSNLKKPPEPPNEIIAEKEAESVNPVTEKNTQMSVYQKEISELAGNLTYNVMTEEADEVSTPDSKKVEIAKPEPLKIEISKPEVKKGFRFSNFLKRGSPKNSKKKKKDSKSEVASESENDEINMNNSDDTLKQSEPTLKGNIKIKTPNSSPPESKKEVRFDLKSDGSFVNGCEVTNVQIKVESEESSIDNENKQAMSSKTVIPCTVAEINLQLNNKKETQSVDDTLLEKLPERVKPPRRKKKHLVPVTVEGMKVENVDGASIISSDSDVRSSREISDDIKIEFKTEKNKKTDESFNTNYLEKSLRNLNEPRNDICNVIVHKSQEEGPSLKADSLNANLSKVSVNKTKVQEDLTDTSMGKQDSPITACKESSAFITTVDLNANSAQLNETIITHLVPSTKENKKDTNQLIAPVESPRSSFEKELTPKFPETNETETSFYDNVNPFYEIMSKVIEEPDVSDSNKRNSLIKQVKTMSLIPEKDEGSAMGKCPDKKEPTFSTTEIHIKNTLDLADVIQNIINKNMNECDFQSSEKQINGDVKQNECIGTVTEMIHDPQQVEASSSKNMDEYSISAANSEYNKSMDTYGELIISEIAQDTKGALIDLVKISQQEACKSPVKENKNFSRSAVENNNISSPILQDKAISSPVNFNKGISGQSTEDKSYKGFSIDELNSLTDEIVRITDDMEKEINFAKEKINVVPKEPNKSTFVPKPLARRHKVDMQTGKVYNLYDHENTNLTTQPDLLPSTFHQKRMHEAASQTDTEYDETDFETESEIDDWVTLQKRKGQSRRFFGPSPLYAKCEESSANEEDPPRRKLAPAVPPRHFQQIMPTRVVDELKLVLSDNEEARLRKPTEQPPRWDSDLSYENGRCNSNMSSTAGSCETQVASSDARLQPSAWQQLSVSSADPPIKQPLSLSLLSNPLTAQNNLIATSVVKHTKTDRSGRLDRRSSSSISTENLAPIPEEGGHASIKKNLTKAESEQLAKTNLKGTMFDPYNPKASKNDFRLRANVYPSFAPTPMILKGKPPVPRPSLKKSSNMSPSFEEGYLSDPGAHRHLISKNNPTSTLNYRKSCGYVTDSEILTHRARSHLNNIYDINLKLDGVKSANEGTVDLTNCEIPPPRPPPPSEDDLLKLDKPSSKKMAEAEWKKVSPLNEELREKEKPLNDLQPNNESKINLSSKAKPIPDSTNLSFSKVFPPIENANVYPISSQITSEQTPQSTFISSCKPCKHELKEENNIDAAQPGTEPKDELSYLQRREHKTELSYVQRRDRPYTWCAPSLSALSDINKFKSERDSLKKFYNQNSVRDDINESRASSQLSQYSNTRRLSVQGLGEWLFLARLDHTNQLLNQLTSTMQLQTDCSIDAKKELQNVSNDCAENINSNRRKSPEPPPRPRTPIDERDPEQVHAEQRYLSYFQGPPRAKHPPGKEDAQLKPPSFQQVEAQKRFENYFVGPPRAKTPSRTPSPPPEDEATLQAKSRYMSYFQKGPPRPRPKSNIETERNTEDDKEVLEAKQRYQSYFQPGLPPPRSRSAVSQEKTPEPDEEQKAAERRYLSYFQAGPPRPRSVSVDADRTQEPPDEEQIAAEKRYLKYFNGLPKAKHEKKEEGEKKHEVTTEMVEAEERFLKYFSPVPCGAPKRLKAPPPPGKDEEKKIKLLKEFQTALESRIDRKQMKIVKVSKPKKEVERESTPPTLRDKVVEEFLQKVQDRKMEKDLHFGDTDDEDEFSELTKEIEKKDYTSEPIIQGGGIIDKRIASDLQLFVSQEEVWSPGGESDGPRDGPSKLELVEPPSFKDVPPVWTPARAGSASPNLGRKEYRKITYDGSHSPRRQQSQENVSGPRPEESFAWKNREAERLRATLGSATSLPRVQSPTVTLLQKKREGQIPGSRPDYIKPDEGLFQPGEKLYTIKREYESEDEEYGSRKFAVLSPKRFEGVGPTTREGVPIALKSGVKSEHQGEWYKRMFDSLHKVKDARYGGYMSEPEGYESDYGSRYGSLNRRENRFEFDVSDSGPRNTKRYVHQPGRIENYVPGFSTLSEKELRENPEADVKLEIKTKIEPVPVAPGVHRYGGGRMQMTHALKESGYESDSTLVFKKREDQRRQLGDTKKFYRQIQQGGEIPLSGLQKPAPPRPKDSSHKYKNSEVNIHYRTPVRVEHKEPLSEEELSRRQEEHMKKVYEQERRKKYLQELEDIERRRHTDYFSPLQKSPIPLNRYDDDPYGGMRGVKTPEPRQVARALFNFSAQNKRELGFNKGDILTIRRSIDRNWQEGELRGVVGIFPCNYVELIPLDNLKTTVTRKPTEGQARARFNFQAQTAMEMSLSKGELLVLTRRVDENWYEGKIGNRKGIFPVSYVDTLIEPGGNRPITPSHDPMPRPALPAAHLLYNGSTSGVSSPYSTTGRPGSQNENKAPYSQLTVNTQQDAISYRALYHYKPQNEDELELIESDIVLVMEKCDDGWFVGTSKRTGLFGTFPGNYVERC